MISLSSGSVLEQECAKLPSKHTPPRVVSGPVTPVPQIVVAGLPVCEEESQKSTLPKLTAKPSILGSLRKFVSGSRTRIKEAGFDLDLSYITNRIIAMGFPAKGIEAAYRNPRLQVISFLRQNHADRYLVFNLCAEEKWQYDAAEFANGVVSIPVMDHSPPSLCQIALFVQRATNWLNQNPDNVVVVHCLGGKGRTGVMVSALLLATRVCSTAEESMEFFNANRGGTGVCIPSQIRYIKLFEEMMILSSNSIPIAITALGVSARNVWTLDSIELGPTRAMVYSVLVRPRSSTAFMHVPLPMLFSNKVSSTMVSIDLKQAQFTCGEDAEFAVKMKKNGYTKFKIKFWFCSEMTQTMLDHRISTSDLGESTLILSAKELDSPDNPVKVLGVNLEEKEEFAVKVHVRFNKY